MRVPGSVLGPMGPMKMYEGHGACLGLRFLQQHTLERSVLGDFVRSLGHYGRIYLVTTDWPACIII